MADLGVLSGLAGFAEGLEKGLDRLERREKQKRDEELSLRRLDLLEQQAANKGAMDSLRQEILAGKLDTQEKLIDMKRTLSQAELDLDRARTQKTKADIVTGAQEKKLKINKQKSLLQRRLDAKKSFLPEDLNDADPRDLEEIQNLQNEIKGLDDDAKRMEGLQDSAVRGAAADPAEPRADVARRSGTFKILEDDIKQFSAVLQKSGQALPSQENFISQFALRNKSMFQGMSRMERQEMGRSLKQQYRLLLESPASEKEREASFAQANVGTVREKLGGIRN